MSHETITLDLSCSALRDSRLLIHSAIRHEFTETLRPLLELQRAVEERRLAVIDAFLANDRIGVGEATHLLNHAALTFMTKLNEDPAIQWTIDEFINSLHFVERSNEITAEMRGLTPSERTDEAVMSRVEELAMLADGAYTLAICVLTNHLSK